MDLSDFELQQKRQKYESKIHFLCNILSGDCTKGLRFVALEDLRKYRRKLEDIKAAMAHRGLL